MERLNLVIVDNDSEYVEALAKLFNKRYYKYFRITGVDNFNNLEKIIASAQKVDILLVNENIKGDLDKLRFIKSIIYLCENKYSENVDVGILYKYQSGLSIYNSIKRIYKSINKNIEFDDSYDEANLVTVFSPVGGVGKTAISVAIADKLKSQGKKVLYLNMEEVSGIDTFFNTKVNNKNISELFYHANQEKEKIDEIVKSISNKEKNGIWYINPVENILDYSELTSRDFIKIITHLKRNTDFDYIITDLGSSINMIYTSILQLADRNLLIMNQSNISVEKISKLLTQLEKTDNISLIVNKYVKEKKIQITDEIAKVKDNIFHYIELDKKLENNDLTLNLISGQTPFSSSLDQLVGKILREESVING